MQFGRFLEIFVIAWARPYSRYRSASNSEGPLLGRCQLLVPVLRNYGFTVKTASSAPFTSRPVKREFSWYMLSRKKLSRLHLRTLSWRGNA